MWLLTPKESFRSTMRVKLYITVFIILLSYLGRPVYGAPWGIDTPARPASMLQRIVARQPVSVCVDGDLSQYSFNPAQLGEAVSRWLRNIYSQISSSGRAEEFKDLEDVLTRPVIINEQNCSYNESIAKQFGRMLNKGSGANGYPYASVQENIRVILLPPEYVSAQVGGKKIVGYLLGQTAQRPAVIALNGASPDIELLWQDMSVALAIPKQSNGENQGYVVNGGTNFSCSDLDDFILGLDCVAGVRPRRGGAEGWKSFCRGSLKRYVNCQAQGGWRREGERGLPSREAYEVWRQVAAHKQDLNPAVLTRGYDPTAWENYDATRKDDQGRLVYARRGKEEYRWTYYPKFTRVQSTLNGEFLHNTDIIDTERYLSIERQAGNYRKLWEIDFLEKGALISETEELADGKEMVFGRKVSFATWDDSREETYDEPDLNLNTTVLRPKGFEDGEWIVVKTDREKRYAGLRVEVDASGPHGLEEYVPLKPQTFLRSDRMLPYSTRFGTDGVEPNFKQEFSVASLKRDSNESRVYEEKFRRLMYNFYPGLDLDGEPLENARRQAGKRWYNRRPGVSPRVHKFVLKK